jgi:hypothetical protein
VAQARSLTFIQRFQAPLRHRTPHLSGNSAAVESFAQSGHGGKYGLAEVLTAVLRKLLGEIRDDLQPSADDSGSCLRRRVLSTSTFSVVYFSINVVEERPLQV